ncbi:hypothetical protein [Acinetobacter sp.]|uniref:hypothetical protein n=1 Tax=Acinetobacter sp. TaxID=472 RepID=UPI0038911752
MYIPAEILEELKKNKKCTANRIAYMFDKPKSTAYRYIQIFKKLDDLSKFDKDHLTNRNNRVINSDDFDKFIFNILNSGGFKSTNQLYQACLKEFPNRNISHRTFNKLFAESRERQRLKLKKRILRITRSKNKPLTGFFTVRRKRKVLDYE